MNIISTTLSPKIKLHNHIAYDVTSKHNINFVSVVEVATKDYFVLLQEMAPSTNKEIYHDVDFIKSRQPLKLKSKYLISFG